MVASFEKMAGPLRKVFRYPITWLFVIMIVIDISIKNLYKIPFFDSVFYRALFAIIMASTVGYWTNYFAIKMLFKPKNKTKLGLQGLIPRNKPKIAKSFGDTIEKNFFNPEYLLAYLEKENIVEKGAKSIKNSMDDYLHRTEVRHKIIEIINKKYNEYSSQIYNFLVTKGLNFLEKFLEDKLCLEEVVDKISNFVEDSVREREINVDKISAFIVNILKEKSQKIADMIQGLIDNEIHKQPLHKKILFKVSKKIMGISPDKIKTLLEDILNDDRTRENIYNFVKEEARKLDEYLRKPAVRSEINKILISFKGWLLTEARERTIPGILRGLNEFLSSSEGWEKIESVLIKIIDFVSSMVEQLISGESFKNLLKEKLPSWLKELKIRKLVEDKVMEFDTDELEALILSTSEEHLGYIEVLGGILGAFVGITMISPFVFIILAIVVSVVIFADLRISEK